VKEAFNWLTATINEIQRRGRWFWCYEEFTTPFPTPIVQGQNSYVTMPPQMREIIEPIFLDATFSGALPAPTKPSTWSTPTTPVMTEYVNKLRVQGMDYHISSFGIEFSSKWSTGLIYLCGYRFINKPVSVDNASEFIDLPDDFVWDLAVYGSARHGLIREDDFKRLEEARRIFETAYSQMVTWDARHGIANASERMAAHSSVYEATPYPVWPSNFSL
jgi:hypothetical protein